MKTVSRRTFLSLLFLALGTPLCLNTLLLPATAQGKKKNEKEAPSAPKAEPKRIFQFPTDSPEGSKANTLTDIVERGIARRLSNNDEYAVAMFFPAMPLIRRALINHEIDRKDVDKPYDKTEKAKKLATLAGYTLVVLSSINDYQYNADKKQVTLDISIRIVDFSGEKPVVIKFVAETATSPADTGKDKTEDKIAIDFARDLVEKLIKDVLKPKAVTPTPTPANDKKP